MSDAADGMPAEAVGDLNTLVARAAALWPEKTGLTFDETGERLSFADIARRSAAIGAALAGIGIGPGDRVAIMLRNRPEFPLAWLGIAQAGAVMVPINTFYKTADAGYLLANSGAKAIVTFDELVPMIQGIDAPGVALETIISVDGDGGGGVLNLGDLLAAAEGAAPSPPEIYAETLANIQYTSGTTGRPKGCMLSHGFWTTFGRNFIRAAHLDGGDSVVLTAQPFYYIDPLWHTVGTLLAGAELVVLDRFHPSTFWAKVREYGVTYFYCLGVMPRLLLKMPPDPADRESQVRFVHCSAIPPASHAEIEARWGVPWDEVYGMTELGFGTVGDPADRVETIGTGCIGRPVPDREARVVDDAGRPVPRGEVGEIVMRGPGMMDGYYRAEEATAEVFKGGWLHTGDLGRMDAAGRLYFAGRKKDMIRRSGENISAMEVEEVIELHPQVNLVACTSVPDDLRGEEVKAHVVLREGAAPESVPPRDLAAFCAERLAYFKVPRYWAYRDDLPRTPSERVRKEALEAEAADPRTGAYDRVDEVWR